jgi:hypothetical protein
MAVGIGRCGAAVGVAYERVSRWLSTSQVCCIREAGRVVGFDRQSLILTCAAPPFL